MDLRFKVLMTSVDSKTTSDMLLQPLQIII